MTRKDEFPLVCPYCGQTLELGPPRKRKCPFCKGILYVRRLPSTRDRVLVTKDEAKKIDLEWEKLHFRKRWLDPLEYYGITEDEFDQLKAHLSGEYGKEASDNDVIWSFLNQLVHERMQTGNWGDLSMLCYQQALFLEGEGREFFHLLQQSRKMELLTYKEEGIITEVQVSTAGCQSCPSCQALEGKVFKISDAVRQMPIPNKECTTYWQNPLQGFCRCTYLAYHPDWEISIRGEELPGGHIGVIRTGR